MTKASLDQFLQRIGRIHADDGDLQALIDAQQARWESAETYKIRKRTDADLPSAEQDVGESPLRPLGTPLFGALDKFQSSNRFASVAVASPIASSVGSPHAPSQSSPLTSAPPLLSAKRSLLADDGAATGDAAWRKRAAITGDWDPAHSAGREDRDGASAWSQRAHIADSRLPAAPMPLVSLPTVPGLAL